MSTLVGRSSITSSSPLLGHQKCMPMSTKTSSSSEETENAENTDGHSNANDESSSSSSSLLLYESPLASIVTRLRFVSVLSAVTGSVGLPLFVAMRGMPPTGLLAVDPATDVVPYKGLRPLCNFCVIKADSTTPLYVHPEYVYNATLRQALQLPQLEPLQQNPDDGLF